jgi:hypothetical protein
MVIHPLQPQSAQGLSSAEAPWHARFRFGWNRHQRNNWGLRLADDRHFQSILLYVSQFQHGAYSTG